MVSKLDVLDPHFVDAISRAISESRLLFHFQGVHDLRNISNIIYGECLARIQGKHGKIYEANKFIPALEFLGEISAVDQHMIQLTLNTLEENPRIVLACNISANTISKKECWRQLLEQIEARRHVADRLVLEINMIRSHGTLGELNKQLEIARILGCRVAINVHKLPNTVNTELYSLQPDIIKIDTEFIWAARRHDKWLNKLKCCVEFSAASAPIVIVKGIENQLDLLHAVQAGATHVQGFFLSKPISKQGGVDMYHYLQGDPSPYTEKIVQSL